MHRLLLGLHLIVAEVVVEREASLVLADLLHGRRIAACWMTGAEMGRRRHLKDRQRRDFRFVLQWACACLEHQLDKLIWFLVC